MKNSLAPLKPDYSKGYVFFARLFFLAEAALSLYFAFSYRMEFGIVYLIYGLISIFLLIPAIRCAGCDYYGRRCSLGWGGWAAKIFPNEYRNILGNLAGLNIIFWPLRLIPILIGIDKILQSIIIGRFFFDQHYLFGIYIVILLLQRILFRTRACPAQLEPSANTVAISPNR